MFRRSFIGAAISSLAAMIGIGGRKTTTHIRPQLPFISPEAKWGTTPGTPVYPSHSIQVRFAHGDEIWFGPHIVYIGRHTSFINQISFNGGTTWLNASQATALEIVREVNRLNGREESIAIKEISGCPVQACVEEMSEHLAGHHCVQGLSGSPNTRDGIHHLTVTLKKDAKYGRVLVPIDLVNFPGDIRLTVRTSEFTQAEYDEMLKVPYRA